MANASLAVGCRSVAFQRYLGTASVALEVVVGVGGAVVVGGGLGGVDGVDEDSGDGVVVVEVSGVEGGAAGVAVSDVELIPKRRLRFAQKLSDDWGPLDCLTIPCISKTTCT